VAVHRNLLKQQHPSQIPNTKSPVSGDWLMEALIGCTVPFIIVSAADRGE
jgi:hypothetical protein